MRTYGSTEYFNTQAAALEIPFADAAKRGYTVVEPDGLWAEHVPYGSTVKYHFPLIVNRTGKHDRNWLHISIYRMDSGSYELTYYFR